MNHLKKYEGFFDLFKKKKSIDTKESEIHECLYELIDNSVSYRLKKTDCGFLTTLDDFRIIERPKKEANALIYGFSLINPFDKDYLNDILLEIKGRLSDIDPNIRLFYVRDSGTSGNKPNSFLFVTEKNWLVIGFSYNDEINLLNNYIRKNPTMMMDNDWVEIK